MGSVSVDIHKKERVYMDFSLSDKNVVKYLILCRSKIDLAYELNTNVNIHHAGDTFEFNQELICLYASLDSLIEKINFKDGDREILELLFRGSSVGDLIRDEVLPQKTAYRTFNRIVSKIIKANNSAWYESTKKNLMDKK